MLIIPSASGCWTCFSRISVRMTVLHPLLLFVLMLWWWWWWFWHNVTNHSSTYSDIYTCSAASLLQLLLSIHVITHSDCRTVYILLLQCSCVGFNRRSNVFLMSSEVKHNRPWAEKHLIDTSVVICAIEHSSEVANIRSICQVLYCLYTICTYCMCVRPAEVGRCVS